MHDPLDRRKFIRDTFYATTGLLLPMAFLSKAANASFYEKAKHFLATLTNNKDQQERMARALECRKGGKAKTNSMEPFCGDRELYSNDPNLMFFAKTSDSTFQLPGTPKVPHHHLAYINRKDIEKFEVRVLERIADLSRGTKMVEIANGKGGYMPDHSMRQSYDLEGYKVLMLNSIDKIAERHWSQDEFDLTITAPSDPQHFVKPEAYQGLFTKAFEQGSRLGPAFAELRNFAGHNHMADAETHVPLEMHNKHVQAFVSKKSNTTTHAFLWAIFRHLGPFPSSTVVGSYNRFRNRHKLFFLTVEDHYLEFENVGNKELHERIKRIGNDVHDAVYSAFQNRDEFFR